MGSSEIWDKYISQVLHWKWDKLPSGITNFQYNTSGIYPKFSLLPMLFHVNTRHVAYV